eukprot:TRINITY_DN1986_c0_g1_i1.p2 TRINITY_DN1986_c0_g1~~TRINITY_DN1986_c0_g1_i1.p2  ORF type:complete len:252 (-),score=24.62 TRINITY_DN1986_c0_g1_i1:42-797(-)
MARMEEVPCISTTKSVFTRCEFRGNQASLGGGIHVLLADIVVEDCVFFENEGKGIEHTNGARGAGIYVDGALDTGLDSPLDGGGIQIFRRTAFDANVSHQKGTGLYLCIYDNGSSRLNRATMEQLRFCGNIAEGPGEVVGAALVPECSGQATLADSVFGGNRALTLSPEFNMRETVPEYQTIMTVSNTVIPGWGDTTSPGQLCDYSYVGDKGSDLRTFSSSGASSNVLFISFLYTSLILSSPLLLLVLFHR